MKTHRKGVKSYVGRGEEVRVYEDGSALDKPPAEWPEGRVLRARTDIAFGPDYVESSEPGVNVMYCTWGYVGEGSRLTAASLIADITGSDELARLYHVALTVRLIRVLPEYFFQLSAEELLAELGACILEANGYTVMPTPVRVLEVPDELLELPPSNPMRRH